MAHRSNGYGFEVQENENTYGFRPSGERGARAGSAGHNSLSAPRAQVRGQNPGSRQAGSRTNNGRNSAPQSGRERGSGGHQARPATPQRPAQRPTQRPEPPRGSGSSGRRSGQAPRTGVPSGASRVGSAGTAGLTGSQMRLYERAYYEKYGRSPYVGGGRGGSADAEPSRGQQGQGAPSRQSGASRPAAPRGAAERRPVPRTQAQTNNAQVSGARGGAGVRPTPSGGAPMGGGYAADPRADRRQAFLREEEMRRREEERARAAAAAAARRQAEKEARRAREMKARAEAEAARQAEIRQRDREGRIRYENEKRRIAKMEAAKVAANRRARAERIEKRKRRRHMWRVFKFHLRVFFITFIVMAALAGVYSYKSFFKDNSDVSRAVKYSYFGGDTVKVGKAVSYRDGSLCVNFTEIAKGLNLYTVGGSRELKYVFPDAESGGVRYMSFYPGSPIAVVNGTPITLSTPAYYSGSVLWVSSDILECFSHGLDYTLSAGKVEINKIIVRDDKGKAVRDENGDIVYEDIVLRYASSDALSSGELSVLFEDDDSISKGKGSEVEFIADLSAYEEYMNPKDSTEFLILVNKTNTVGEDFVPNDLCDLVDTRSDRAPRQMRKYAAIALEAMFIEMRAAGYTDVSVTSGYRSYGEQVSLFNTYITNEMAERGCTEEEARQIVLTYSAAPGTSEHQTGLCVDMHNLPAATTAFADEEVYDWLTENAWKFGFILRFPEDKTAITGYSFEPWHYRYVGRYAAEKIHNEGLCLEEYLAG